MRYAATILLIVLLMLQSCARVGAPVGGKKDTIRPVPLRMNIDSSRIRVSRTIGELRIDFDEYVTLKNVSRELIISPPIKRIKKIMPSNLPTKFVQIQWEDTLQANTTYSFNFGNAIADYNEGNILPYFTVAFSTGEKLDTQFVSGFIKQSFYQKLTDEQRKAPVTVALYTGNEKPKATDKPYYITRADESDGYFEINYIQPGTYWLLAFKDFNSNGIYDQNTEPLAYSKEALDLTESKKGISLPMYTTKLPEKLVEIKNAPGGLALIFQGNPKNPSISEAGTLPTSTIYSHIPYSDTVRVYFPEFQDKTLKNLAFTYTHQKKTDTVKSSYRPTTPAQMRLENISGGSIPPTDDLMLSANMDIDKVNTENWKLTEDSLTILPFTLKTDSLDKRLIKVKAQWNPGKKYMLSIPKNALSSYFVSAPAHIFEFSAGTPDSYGSLTLRLQDIPTHPFWLQILDTNQKIRYNAYGKKSEHTADALPPGEYTVRILIDENENGNYDFTDYAENTFAEPILYLDKKLTVRPLWKIVEDWNLNGKSNPKTLEKDD